MRRRRKVLGLTQRRAAEAIGVSHHAVVRWETEPRIPDACFMPGIVRFLGYDPQPPAQTFPELIRRSRRTLGLTQPGIAKALKIPLPSLRAWEQGLYEPKKERMQSVETKLKNMLSKVGHSDG